MQAKRTAKMAKTPALKDLNLLVKLAFRENVFPLLFLFLSADTQRGLCSSAS
jgi:hypothetical protein